MSNETKVTVVPEIESPKANPRGRYMAYMQCVRKLEMKAKAEKEAAAKGGNQ